MTDPLNRYFAYLLDYQKRIKPSKLKAMETDPDQRVFLRFHYKRLIEDTTFLKQTLAKRQEDAVMIHDGMVAHLKRQLALFHTPEKGNDADKTTPQEEMTILQTISSIFWTLAMCACSRGELSAPVPTNHLGTIASIIVRRIVALLLGQLKKQQFNSQADVVNFFERYIPDRDEKNLNRWKWIFRRAILPV